MVTENMLLPTRISISCLMLVVLLSAAPLGKAGDLEDRSRGLVVHGGALSLHGKPYRGIGANYFNLFSRRLKNDDDTSYRNGLRELSDAGIPFVRFMCSGFWPSAWDLYLRDKEAYFSMLDDVVEAAEQHRVGLIPSLFWNMSTVPDVVGEPMDQLGNPQSDSIALIRRYTEEVVVRYRNSPAVWGWEFGNEYNLHADLPNASAYRPAVAPRFKTPTSRSERDELTSTQMLVAFREFAATVRKHDPHRVLITGNSIPRSSAYHNSTERSWTKDTVEQFAQILLRDNPDPFDTISIHIYPNQDGQYSAGAKDLDGLIRNVMQHALADNRPLVIGEFGAPATLGPDKERAVFHDLVDAIVDNNVPLAAFWVFDYDRQDGQWNVTLDNNRSYMIDVVAKANARMQESPE